MLKKSMLALSCVIFLAASARSQTAASRREEFVKRSFEHVASLQDKSFTVRRQAYYRLTGFRSLPKEIAPALAKIVAAETGEARILAAAVLAEITPDDAGLAKPLGEGLTSKEVFITVASVKGLNRLGPVAKPAYPSILVAMENLGIEAAKDAIPLVVAMGKEAVGPLEKIILKAHAKKKFEAAALALGKIGPDATSTILRLFEKEDPDVDWHLAVALGAMDKKPAEALKPMLRLYTTKDPKLRMIAIEYFVGLNPAPPAVEELIWEGLRDQYVAHACKKALRGRDPKRWAQFLKSAMETTTSAPLLQEFCLLDPQEGKAFVRPVVLRIMNEGKPGSSGLRLDTVAALAAMENDLPLALPGVLALLNKPAKTNVHVRINVAMLLRLLPPHHTEKVKTKLEPDLKATRWELKLAVARALARTKSDDHSAVAKALAEVLTVTRPVNDYYDDMEILNDIPGLAPGAKASIPALRIALTTAQPPLKARILLTMAAIDPDQKESIAGIARKMQESAAESSAGSVVLFELGLLKSDEAMKIFEQTLNDGKRVGVMLRLLESVGPKAKALIPRLTELLDDPENHSQTHTIVALGRVDGDTKLMMERLLKVYREERLQKDSVLHAFGTLGAEARSALPTLFKLAQDRGTSLAYRTAIARIDPSYLLKTSE